MIYLLTGYVDYESETPLLVTDNLEAAKAGIPEEGLRGFDAFFIYEAELGQQPEVILENVVGMDFATHRYGLRGWEQA